MLYDTFQKCHEMQLKCKHIFPSLLFFDSFAIKNKIMQKLNISIFIFIHFIALHIYIFTITTLLCYIQLYTSFWDNFLFCLFFILVIINYFLVQNYILEFLELYSGLFSAYIQCIFDESFSTYSSIGCFLLQVVCCVSVV